MQHQNILKKVIMKKSSFTILCLTTILLFSLIGVSYSQATTFTVTLDKAVNGTVNVEPPLPADGKYPAGTVVTLTATPDKGFVLDALFHVVASGRGTYQESMTSPFKVTIDKDKRLGASFIEKSAVDHIKVTQDVVFAKPGVKQLKYDVYSPKGAKNLPCIIIIHGGGWTSNTEDIMLDGDETNNTMANLIEDVYGAIAHIREHAAEYGGDPDNIGLTGDSAGGHLSAACSVTPNKIGNGGFGKTAGVFEFMPSYLPKNKTMGQVRTEMMNAIKAAAPSYGVFGGTMLNTFSEDPAANDSWREAISPINNIPDAKERSVPQYLTRGTNDGLIKDENVKAYVDALVKAGQTVQYVQVGGAGHAFFDWKPDERTKATFVKYGVYYAAEMKAFFNSVFYK